MTARAPERSMVLWFPDWPVQAARLDAGDALAEPIAVAAHHPGGRGDLTRGGVRRRGGRRRGVRSRRGRRFPGLLRLALAAPAREELDRALRGLRRLAFAGDDQVVE